MLSIPSPQVYEMSKVKQNFERAQMLKEWHEGGAGVMILGYDMYRNLVQGSHCKNKKQKKIFFETLAEPGMWSGLLWSFNVFMSCSSMFSV